MRSRLALHLALLGAALVLADAPAAVGASSHATSIGSTDREVRVAFDFDVPEWVETAHADRTYRRPVWADIPAQGEADQPALPALNVRVAVPWGGPVILDFRTTVRGQSGGVRFLPQPGLRPPYTVRAGAGRPDAEGEMVVQEGTSYLRSEPLPCVEILGEGVERGVRVVALIVRPVSWSPASGAASWMSRVEVSLGVADARPLREPRRPPDRVSASDWGATLLNPSDAARFAALPSATAPALPTPTGVPEVWFDDATGWLKIRIAATGLYGLDAAALAAAGVEVATLDPRELRLFAGPLVPEVPWGGTGWDTVVISSIRTPVVRWLHTWERPSFAGFGAAGGFQEVAIAVPGEGDGRLDAGDEIVFYALGPDNFRDRFGLPLGTPEDFFRNPYAKEVVYWLALGDSAPGAFPGAPRRMASVAAAPAGGGSPVTESMARVHAEEDHEYDPSLYIPGLRWEEYFWDFYINNTASAPKVVPLPYAVAGSTLDAQIRLWGAQVPSREGGETSRHQMLVTVNGESCYRKLVSWGGASIYLAVTPQDVFARDVCALNPSRFAFANVDPPGAGSRFDNVRLAWIDVHYRRTLHAGGGPAELAVDAGAAGRTVRVDGAPTGTFWILDVTDPRAPRRLEGAVRNGSALEVALAGDGAAVLALAGGTQLRAPAALELDTPPEGGWLRDARASADYVIICADALVEAGEELAAWRREHLYPYTPDRPARVRVVRVSDVMDEFAWGLWDPVALRYFLEYAYTYYTPVGSDRPAYCLFLGDHTSDPRNTQGYGQPDLVPSWEDNRDDLGNLVYGSVQYVSDEPLAQFDGRNDLFTDFYLGRITAESAAEAQDLVRNKVIQAEAAPQYGPWRAKAIFVADDICQTRKVDGLCFTHMGQAEDVVAVLPRAFDAQKVYLYEFGEDCAYDSKPLAKRALLDGWNEGAWLVEYIGHGADVVLADEHVFDLADIPTLANDDRLPIFGAFSCSVGKFAKPQFQGLGEALLRRSRAGSLVSFAASQLTYSTSNFRLNQDCLKELFPVSPVEPASVGAAIMRAKRTSAPIGSDRIDRKYHCLGDPGSRPGVPGLALTLEGPSALSRGEAVAFRARVAGDEARDGVLDVLARDARIKRTKNSQGETFAAHASRMGCYQWILSYKQDGPVLFRGSATVAADTAQFRFVVPVSLRGGPDGRVRAYAHGDGWDALGTADPLVVGGLAPAGGDTLGPVIRFSVPSGRVVSGQEVTATLEDSSGINLTRLFEFRSILLKVLADQGLEQFREDLTDRFQYDRGSYTRGGCRFRVPELAPGTYSFVLSATDTYNNRSQVGVDLDVVGSTEGGSLSRVFCYPNPFDPAQGSARLVFTLDRAAEVTLRFYAVSGRLVRESRVTAPEGTSSVPWDGKDAAGDPVANGVYLVQVAARPQGGGETERHLERVVVLR